MLLSRWGWIEVSSIHPAPVSLVFSLHKSNPVVVSEFNDFRKVILEIKIATDS